MDGCRTHITTYGGPDTVINVKEEVETYGHHYRSLKGSKDDIGGPFASKKQKVEISGTGPHHLGDGHGNCYHGHVVPWDFQPFSWGGDWPVGPAASSDDRLLAYGSTAIARTLPTNPVGQAAQFLGELREGLPSLVGSTFFKDRRLLKNIGGEHLNVEFGIKPFISDFQKFARAVKESHKILAQLERDSGKVVRRRYEFPEEVTTTTIRSDNSNNYVVRDMRGGAFSTFTYQEPGTYEIIDEVKKRRWFSGAYTYYVPPLTEMHGLSRYVAEADKLLGVKLTPDVLWQLTPWSWAVDWFGNYGDVIHNLSMFNQDGLVMRYGYIMEETTASRTVRASQVLLGASGQKVRVAPTFKYSYITKRRLPATPFGFGIDFPNFTGRQLAIMAALGLSRGRR